MFKRLADIFVGLLVLGVISACGPTATPESTAIPALAESILTPVPGWTKFQGAGMEIWLPESYVGGDLIENLDSVVDEMQTLSADFEPIVQKIEQNPSLYVIWAFDSALGESGFLTNVSVINEETFVSEEKASELSVDLYLDLTTEQLPEQFQVVNRDVVMIGNDPVGRLFIEVTLYDMPAKEVMYVIQDGTTFWVITFTTGLAEFDPRLPEFEQAMLTFRTQP